MKLTLQIWRQENTATSGHYETFEVDQLDSGMSILEMLDRLNEQLIHAGKESVQFESDCRESICGCCGLTVNGRPHGPQPHVTTCMQRLRMFTDGSTVRIEPLRSASFPVLRDLIVDRSPLDRIIAAGGHVAVPAGTAPDPEAMLIDHTHVERALDFAACIGCGACVAACPNGAAALFTGAKVTHLSMLPVPSVERKNRAEHMVATMEENFGPCSQYGECANVCPQEVPLTAIASLQKERLKSFFAARI
ncbi:MAG: succinate dehydrogenase/fumarate reductase iron-sulfur subunit [Propionibacteriaceae bacterium]|nr:succinate dehydrogenase/fumarate reductase iron-sulfur subunit [Propionibacteriaceae bacterium]